MIRLPAETLKDAGERASRAGARAAYKLKDEVRAASGIGEISEIAGCVIRSDKRGLVGDPCTQETWKLRFWEGFMTQAELLRDGG